jgi:pyruvate formate lyase activating enzyme
MLQHRFLREVMELCQGSALHVALDTCGAAAWERYEELLPLLDLVLYDLKIHDGDCHRSSTGADNCLIQENAQRISEAGLPMWVRTPVIPGHTADPANIAALGRFIAGSLPSVQRWDLLAYTNLGQPKYHRLDRPYALDGVPLMTGEEMEALHAIATEHVPVAVWSGATREPEDIG